MNDLGGKVFLSYSRQDFYVAEEVYADLLGKDVDVWMDAAEINPGDTWLDNLSRAIQEADTVLFVALQVINHYAGPSGGLLRVAVFADAVVAVVLLVLLLGSTSVLRRSQTGSGSVVARWMILRRAGEKNVFAAVQSLLGDHVPFELDELSALLEPAPRGRTFTVVHEAADAPLAARISEVCRTVGLIDAPVPARADQRLLLVSNTTDVAQLHRNEAGGLGIPVLACSLDRVTDSDLMQRQWVDFRNDELNLREIAQVTGRPPRRESRTRTFVPVPAGTCRLPLAIAADVRALILVALSSTLVVLSNTYWNILGAQTNTARLVLAMGIAVVTADVVRLIVQRKASPRQLRREQLLLAAMSLAFAVVTGLDPALWFGHKILTAAIAAWFVTDPFVRDRDLEAWLPATPVPSAPPALGFPLTLSTLVISPWFYAMLMLAGATTLVSPL